MGQRITWIDAWGETCVAYTEGRWLRFGRAGHPMLIEREDALWLIWLLCTWAQTGVLPAMQEGEKQP